MYVNLGRYKQEQNLDDASGRKSHHLQARVRMQADHNAGKLYLQKGFAMQSNAAMSCCRLQES